MIKRQIFRESSYRPHVISHKGAVGLMQVLPSTASDFCQYSITIEMLKDKLFNVTIGIRYLLHLRGFYIYLGYDSSKAMQLAMCSYYEGPGATISRHFKGKLCKATKKAYYRYYVFNKTPKPLTNLPKVKLNSYAKFIVGV
jgi:soluble lytic murein transglycosylase-like protein